MKSIISIGKEVIVKSEEEILNAMINRNVAKLDELLHKDLLFNIPNGQTITKSIDIETYSSGNMVINGISSSELEINLIGDTAIVSMVVEMKGTYFDYTLDGKYKVMRVWKLFNNQLKVIAGSSIRI